MQFEFFNHKPSYPLKKIYYNEKTKMSVPKKGWTVNLWYHLTQVATSGAIPISFCGSKDHSTLRSCAGFSAHPTCSLERRSMFTVPRHSLFGFADYAACLTHVNIRK